MKIAIATTQESNEDAQKSFQTSIISLAEIPFLLRIVTASDVSKKNTRFYFPVPGDLCRDARSLNHLVNRACLSPKSFIYAFNKSQSMIGVIFQNLVFL